MLLFLVLLIPPILSFQTSLSSSKYNENSSDHLFPLFTFNDYNETVNCNVDSFKKDENRIQFVLDSINLRWIDSIVFVTLGTVTFISTSFIILTFIMYPQTREPPGDIILGISISEFILTIHWMVSACWFLYDPIHPPPSDGAFCLVNSVFSMIAGTFEFLYNCAFCIYVIFKIKNVQKGGSQRRDVYHIVCFLINFGLIMYIGFTEILGKNLFGTCSVKAVSRLPLIGPLLFFIYVVLAFSTIMYFKKHVPNEERFQEYREKFLNYYYKYIKACAIIWSVLAFCNIVAVINCNTTDGGIAGLNIFLTIGNIAKLFTPLVLSILRYQDPFLNKKVKSFFQCLKNFISRKTPSNANIDDELLGREKRIELGINQPEERKSIGIEDPDIWNDIKVMFTYTMISGILLNYKNVRGALRMSQTAQKQNFNSQKRYKITKEIFNLYLPNEMKELDNKRYNTFSTNMIVYAPEVFEDLIAQDQDMIELELSLDLEKNYEQIQKASGSDGGKGGEFFFFSYDNRVILKTLSQNDLTQLRGILKDYYRYFKTNKDSLIAKIYGIYTFERTDIKDQRTSILLMRNIAACPKKYVIRTYDLKGSTFDREVLKNKPGTDSYKGTLKDLDFLKLEKKIFIEEKFKQIFHTILGKDSEFFRNKKLIDYSLIVFKIDKKKYFEDLAKEGINTDDFFLNKKEMFSLKSVEEDGIFYHIGIIDYLQPYNFQKFIEKNFKKCMKADVNLNTSSQDPATYQERFCKFMKEII